MEQFYVVAHLAVVALARLGGKFVVDHHYRAVGAHYHAVGTERLVGIGHIDRALGIYLVAGVEPFAHRVAPGLDGLGEGRAVFVGLAVVDVLARALPCQRPGQVADCAHGGEYGMEVGAAPGGLLHLGCAFEGFVGIDSLLVFLASYVEVGGQGIVDTYQFASVAAVYYGVVAGVDGVAV